MPYFIRSLPFLIYRKVISEMTTHLLFQANIRDKTYRWERYMYQRDERLTGDPYKANVSKFSKKVFVYFIMLLCKYI